MFTTTFIQHAIPTFQLFELDGSYVERTDLNEAENAKAVAPRFGETKRLDASTLPDSVAPGNPPASGARPAAGSELVHRHGITPRPVCPVSPRLRAMPGRQQATAQPVITPAAPKRETVLPDTILCGDKIDRATTRTLLYLGGGICGCLSLIAATPILPAGLPIVTPMICAATALAALAGKLCGDAQASRDLDTFLTKPGSRAQYLTWLRRQTTDSLMKVCLSPSQIENLECIESRAYSENLEYIKDSGYVEKLDYVSYGKRTVNDCPFIRPAIRPMLRPLLLDVLANESDPTHLVSDIAWLRTEVFKGIGRSHGVNDCENMIAFGKTALDARRKARA